MRHIFIILSIVLTTVFLTSCDETLKITNGKIPDQFVPAATTYLGSYQGKIERENFQINLALTQDNRVVMNTFGDLAGDGCQSAIGNLHEISYNKNDDGSFQLTSAKFDFDANLCAAEILGKEVTLDFVTKNNRKIFNLSIFHYTEWHQDCHIGGGGFPHHPPHDVCSLEPEYHYIVGKFSKI